MTTPAEWYEKHRDLLDKAIEATAVRDYWSAYPESPSKSVYGEDAAPAGERAALAQTTLTFAELCELYLEHVKAADLSKLADVAAYIGIIQHHASRFAEWRQPYDHLDVMLGSNRSKLTVLQQASVQIDLLLR